MIVVSKWSVLYSLCLGTVLILLFHLFLRKRNISVKNAVTPYLALLLLIVLRAFIPLEFGKPYVIRSRVFLTGLNDFLKFELFRQITVLQVIAVVWIVGAVISVLKWIKAVLNIRKFTELLKDRAETSSIEYQQIAGAVGLDCKKIYLSKDIDEVVTLGVFDYAVFLPDMEYQEADLLNILSHEAIHIKNRDLFVKAILHLAACVLWWNPVMNLLEYDFTMLMEYRCDEDVIKSYSGHEKIAYVETIRKMAVVKQDSDYRYRAAGFATASQKSILTYRADRILNSNRKRNYPIVIALTAAIVIVSYIVVPQPHYEAEHVAGEIDLTKENAYIKKNSDDYTLFIWNEDWGIIPEEELGTEPYCCLEIIN